MRRSKQRVDVERLPVVVDRLGGPAREQEQFGQAVIGVGLVRFNPDIRPELFFRIGVQTGLEQGIAVVIVKMT